MEAVCAHDRFAEILRKNGVEVVYYVDEAARALERPDIKDRFIREMLDQSHFSSRGVKEAIYAYLISMNPRQLVEKVIAGIRKTDLTDYKPRTLAEKIDEAYKSNHEQFEINYERIIDNLLKQSEQFYSENFEKLYNLILDLLNIFEESFKEKNEY